MRVLKTRTRGAHQRREHRVSTSARWIEMRRCRRLFPLQKETRASRLYDRQLQIENCPLRPLLRRQIFHEHSPCYGQDGLRQRQGEIRMYFIDRRIVQGSMHAHDLLLDVPGGIHHARTASQYSYRPASPHQRPSAAAGNLRHGKAD